MVFRIYKSLGEILIKVIRLVLQKWFRFEMWHTSPARRRKYVRDTVEIANGVRNRGVVMEIGCGLGDIVGNCDYTKRYFLDSSKEVLKAAKFIQLFKLSRSQNIFKLFKLGENKLPSNLLCDTIILVNWIHAIETKILAQLLDDLTTNHLKIGGTLILDVLSSESESQIKTKVNVHEITDIVNPEKFDINVKKGYKMGRRIVIARKNR